MVERYHLVLAAWAVGAGLLLAATTRFAPSFVQRRLVALAGLTGAVLGAWNDPRRWPWLVAAALVVAWSDDPTRPHPLEEWAAPLAVVSLVGVWASVPDTEPALAAGAVLALLALALAVTRRPVGPAGTVALGVAVLGPVWVGSADGARRWPRSAPSGSWRPRRSSTDFVAPRCRGPAGRWSSPRRC